MFQEELDFFQKNQDKLVEQYSGKILVIKSNKVIGVYSSALDAFNETVKKYKPGSFMIQPCKAGPDAYTVTISTLGIITNKA